MKTILLLCALYISWQGSQIAQAPVNTSDTTTLNGHWYLQPLLPADTATGKTPELHFNMSSSSFSGNTGCNAMNGRFTKTDSNFVFNPQIAVTRRFCSGYDEAAFLRNLQRTNGYKLENGVLVLLFDATELSRWARKPASRLQIRKA